MLKEFTLPLNEIETLSKFLVENLKNKNIIVMLRGDLASGKTTLVKNFVKSFGIKEDVTSPTFALQSIYEDKIYHYDVYNKSLNEFVELGMLEEFEKEGIHFVEWGDEKLEKILDDYGFDFVIIDIKKQDNIRRYIIKSDSL